MNTNKQEDQSDVSDKTEQYRARLMNKYSGEWDMEKVSAIAHLCVEVEPLVRKFANCYNENCITCPDNAESMSLFINARQDRAVAEAERIYKAVRNDSRVILYNDPMGRPDEDGWRDQASRDDLWAISTEELNILCGKLTNNKKPNEEEVK